ncbi:MAG: FAD-binding protein [Gemmatirosa sp.]
MPRVARVARRAPAAGRLAMTTAVRSPVALPALGAPRDEQETGTLVREAAARRTRLRLVGRGTWLDAGRPVRADAALHLAELRGIVDYVPGDLTLTARAGTPLADIARVTAAEGQLLALDPFGDAAGTIGATVATASSGPLAHAFGGPRDNVLGLAFVTGTGDVVRAGGRVVKNVAGFDLVRLLTGAWGTLGAITEVSVRLRARAEVDATVAVALPAATRELGPWLERLRAAPLAAWALELVNAPLATHLGLGDRALVLARLAGNAQAVAAQRATLAALGDLADAPADVWARLRACEPADATVARLSARPTRLSALCGELFAPAARAFGLMAHATVSRGVVRFVLPGAEGFGMPRGPQGDRPARRSVERLPAALWQSPAAGWGAPPADDALSRRVRAAFDPHGILNVGAMSTPDIASAAPDVPVAPA